MPRFIYLSMPTLAERRETLGDARVDYDTLVARILDNQRFVHYTEYTLS